MTLRRWRANKRSDSSLKDWVTALQSQPVPLSCADERWTIGAAHQDVAVDGDIQLQTTATDDQQTTATDG